MSVWTLHPRLAADCVVVGALPLSQLLWMNDKSYPWAVLVPRIAEITEIHQLGVDDRQQLMHESCLLAEVMVSLYQAEKMNVAALGNMVPQLHLHHVARYRHDSAWPAPVWGHQPAIPYQQEALETCLQQLREHLPLL